TNLIAERTGLRVGASRRDVELSGGPPLQKKTTLSKGVGLINTDHFPRCKQIFTTHRVGLCDARECSHLRCRPTPAARRRSGEPAIELAKVKEMARVVFAGCGAYTQSDAEAHHTDDLPCATALPPACMGRVLLVGTTYAA